MKPLVDDLVVIVGPGVGGQREIVEALTDLGYTVETTNKMWPRDHFVYFMGEYILSGSPGATDGDPFAEGGNIVCGEDGNDFLIISDSARMHDVISQSLPDRPTYGQIDAALVAAGEARFPGARIYTGPTGYFHGGKGHVHIDMFTLYLPTQRALILDTHHARGAARTTIYDAIAEREGLRLIRYDGSQDGVWYPLNSLVLPGRDGVDVAIIDRKSTSLMHLLNDEGLLSAGVRMPQHNRPGGKIHCQTNAYRPSHGVTMRRLLCQRFTH